MLGQTGSHCRVSRQQNTDQAKSKALWPEKGLLSPLSSSPSHPKKETQDTTCLKDLWLDPKLFKA